MVSYPWAILAIVPLIIVTALIASIFHQSLRELKRLDNISRSPVMSHLTATVEGNGRGYHIPAVVLYF